MLWTTTHSMRHTLPYVLSISIGGRSADKALRLVTWTSTTQMIMTPIQFPATPALSSETSAKMIKMTKMMVYASGRAGLLRVPERLLYILHGRWTYWLPLYGVVILPWFYPFG
ncbi:hypothetical protein K458DRAFT_425792, partial [Lentithecium fluviatile CBS 122367]